MLDVLAAGTDRTLVVPPLRPLRAPAPSVRAALAVYAAADTLQEAASGEEESVEEGLPKESQKTLRCVCSEWLPLRTFSVLFSHAFSDGRRLQALQALIAAGRPNWVERQEASDTEPQWHALIARYRAVYGGTVEDILSEPWHAFVSQLRQTRRIQAREQIRFIRAYTGLRSSDGEDILDEIFSDARLEQGGGEEVSPEAQAEREKVRDKLMAEAWQKRQHLLN